ncbi:MAG TPA: ABC transporter substrate-binding protein [Gaiellaceae bacterium]|nr:ABC transporter substrate-binding protein [Gaiellaceae bacterium]
MIRFRRARAAIAAASALALISTIGAAAHMASGAGKPTLTIGLSVGPASLDPSKDGNGQSSIAHILSNATITRLNADGSIVGDLASSFHYVGSGNKVFEFTIRPDARFSDGSRVTASAVASWLQYFSKSNSVFVSNMGKIASIATPGPRTVRLTLQTPNPIVPLVLSQVFNWGYVSSPRSLANPAAMASNTFGAGPYALVPSESVTGDHYTYVPNKFYFAKSKVHFSKVIVKVISTPASMLAAATAGQVDVGIGDASTADAAAKSSALKVIHTPIGYDAVFLLDRGGVVAKPLGDVRVRQALNYAVDRAAITKALVGKYGHPTSQAPSADSFRTRLDNYYKYDPAKAKALLAQAGYANGFKLDILTFPAGNLGDPFVQAVAKYLQAVGVNVNVTSPTSVGEYIGDLFSGKFPAATLPQFALPMWLTYQQNVKPKAILNPFGASDPVANELFVKAQRLTTRQGLPYWQKMSERLTTNAWSLPVFDYDYIFYVSKHVAGVKVTTEGYGSDPTVWTKQ